MEYRNLGRSGLQVSVAGLGCNNFGRRCDIEQTKAVVGRALDLGVTLFDTADIYGPGGLSEEYLGEALKGQRQNVVIATKFAGPTGEGPMHGGGSRRYIYNAIEASLRRLGTDYVDLYQIHFPDVRTPIEETMRALDDIVRSGKARYIGCSNFAAWQVVEAQWIAQTEHLTPFASAQNQYSLLERRIERDLVQVSQKYGLGVLPYFPARKRLPLRQVSSGRTAARGDAARWRRRHGGPRTDARELRDARAHRSVRPGAWARRTRRGDRLARQPAERAERDRRRHEARAGRAERERGGVAP